LVRVRPIGLSALCFMRSFILLLMRHYLEKPTKIALVKDTNSASHCLYVFGLALACRQKISGRRNFERQRGLSDGHCRPLTGPSSNDFMPTAKALRRQPLLDSLIYGIRLLSTSRLAGRTDSAAKAKQALARFIKKLLALKTTVTVAVSHHIDRKRARQKNGHGRLLRTLRFGHERPIGQTR
jgi:hypothetical protein